MTSHAIINRHLDTLKGVLRACTLTSTELGIKKPFYVYEPPGLQHLSSIPTLYLFRGHEREWVNVEEDSSRKRTTAIEDIDKAISLGIIPPVLVVMPGLNSANNHVPSLGINMSGTWPASMKGLGSGNYWNYLTEELMPFIQTRYPNADDELLAAGFSLGGYTVSLLAIHKPGLLQHAGIYDGLFMWPEYRDPRAKPDKAGNDTVWTKGPLFDAAFGKPRDTRALKMWNPTDTLLKADAAALEILKQTTWWISCAAADGQKGNLDRAVFYRELMQSHAIPVGFDEVIFDLKANHSWLWADTFLISFLSSALSDQA